MALSGSVSRWFNRKGFGFINVLNSDSEHVGNDIFVHLSGINYDGYKCLYPGEYVSFDLDKNKDGKPICVNVTGVMGGPLLVEHPEYRFKYSSKVRRNDSEQVSEPVPDDEVDEVDEVDENDPENDQ